MNHIFGSFDMILIIISDQNIQYKEEPKLERLLKKRDVRILLKCYCFYGCDMQINLRFIAQLSQKYS